MKQWLAVIVFFVGLLAAAQDAPIPYSVQLIRATDASTPPRPDAHPASPELVHRLGMFKWKNYWELRHENVSLRTGAKSRLRLTPEREVELSRGPRDLTIAIYANGKLTRRRSQPLDRPFYIAGGEKENAECWFIVVHREN